jgi:glycosyltransferase involved in cell wall biosynthesis
MSQPLFSIITPTYNSLAGLRHSFDSVQAQSPDLFEYWVVDGASTDGTDDWLREKSCANFHWISEPDSGVYDAMNKAIQRASGQFFYFLGSGDRLTHGILESAAKFIDSLPSAKPRFIYGDVRLNNRDGRLLGGTFTSRRLCRENISHQAIFYEKSIFELLGLYDVKYPIYSDWAFNLRCFGDKRISKYRWDQVIADFEGNGLSDRVPDVPFALDHMALVQRHLGTLSVLQFRLERKLNRLKKRLSTRSK